MGNILKTKSSRMRTAWGSDDSRNRRAPSATHEVPASQECCLAMSQTTLFFSSETFGFVTVRSKMSRLSTVLPLVSLFR